MAGDSSSPHEAMIAAKRARSLIDKHQIKKIDLFTENDQFGTTEARLKYPRKPTWIMWIAGAISDLNDCKSIIVTSDIITFEFKGFRSDAIIAKYIFDYLIDTCNKLLNDRNIKGISNKNFYRLGFSKQIIIKVREITTKREREFKSTDGKELVSLKVQMVDAHFGTFTSVNKPKPKTPNKEELMSMMKGMADAKKTSLNQQIK